jgi:hypothetical protein
MPKFERKKPSHAKAAEQHLHWDEAGWEAECRHKASKLLKRRAIGLHRITDRLNAFNHRVFGRPWIRRTVLILTTLAVISGVSFIGLWLRLGAGPINLDIVTPLLASAIEQNLGHDHTVEVGGTQIERAGRIRIAVRLRNIVVRDRNKAIVASAPKAEVRLSGAALLLGNLRAESLRLVGAELSVRITPDGDVIVSTGGNTTQPLATGKVPAKPAAIDPARPSASPAAGPLPTNGLLAALDLLDGVGASQGLTEIGLRNGVLSVDDQQSKTRFTFENISMSVRRPAAGGVTVTVGEDGSNAWSLKLGVGPSADGVRAIEMVADKVPSKNLLLSARLKDFTFTTSQMPLSGVVRGEVGRDGMPTFLTGELTIGKGTVYDRLVPNYPMNIDRVDMKIDWDAARRVMVAPFQITSGTNRLTLLAHLEPPNDAVPNWQLGISGGTIFLTDIHDENPLILNRIAIRVRFDTEHRRTVMTQCDISNGEVGIAGSGAIDYSQPDARLTLGLALTPMSVTQLKNVWPSLVAPEVREWTIQRIESGALQHLDIAINAPLKNLVRGGPPIPDEGLAVDFSANNVVVKPVDDMPLVHDADMKGHVTGRTVKVNVGQGNVDTPAGRKMTISDFTFEVPDLVPKDAPTNIHFRLEGPVPAAAEVLQSGRLSDVNTTPIDPNSAKGTVAANISLTIPLKNELTKEDTLYSANVDLGGLTVDKLAMNQKLEASALKLVADNQGFRFKGDVKIGGQPASLEYRKGSDGEADIRLAATLDDAARAKLGVDLGSSISGAIPIKLTGTMGADHENHFGVDADLTAAKVDNLLPGWTKIAGKATHVTFNVVQKPQSTRFEDVLIEGSGTLIKGSAEVDQNNDLMNVNFPTFAPSEGDKASLRADRGPDGALKVTLRGDVFDGRGFVKSALSGNDSKAKQKIGDIDIDAKVGVVAGFYGEAVRGLDVKLSRRGGMIKSFSLAGKLGRDTPLNGSLRSRSQGRDLLFIETSDAGALFRFTDTYSKMNGGQMWVAMDTPTADSAPQEGLLNVSDFTIKGEAALDRVVNGGSASQNGVAFSRMRTEFTRQTGQLRIRDGVVRGPSVGATIEGAIDYSANQVRMSGTFVPMYGLNNMFGQIPIVGLVLGGGSNEGLIGLTYEVVGSPGAPVLRVNPISAMAPGVLRKIFEFGTGRQTTPADFAAPTQN